MPFVSLDPYYFSLLCLLDIMAARVPPADILDCETFEDWFGHPTNDHFDGSDMMTVASTGAWDGDVVTASVLNLIEGTPLAFVGLFPDPGHPATGTTRLIMFPKTYPASFRGANPYAGRTFAFIDEVASGTAPSVCFPADPFVLGDDDATVIPTDIGAFLATYGGHANALNARLTAGAGMQEVRCTMLT